MLYSLGYIAAADPILIKYAVYFHINSLLTVAQRFEKLLAPILKMIQNQSWPADMI